MGDTGWLQSAGLTLLFLLPLGFLAIFYVYPLVSILRVSFTPDANLGAGGIEAAGATLLQASFWQVAWFTTWQAALSTLLTVVAGLPMAYVFATYSFRGKTVLHALLTIPFVMPTVVVASAFLALVGQNGMLNQALQRWFGLQHAPLQLEHSLALILAAHVFFNVSVIIRTVGGFWSTLNPHLAESAAVLGARPWRSFATVTLPLLLPSLLAASLLVFLFCFTSFGVILILGGPTFATLEVEIYRQAVYYFNLPVAATLTIAQLVVTFTIMIIYTRMQARTSRQLRLPGGVKTAKRPRTWRQWMLITCGSRHYDGRAAGTFGRAGVAQRHAGWGADAAVLCRLRREFAPERIFRGADRGGGELAALRHRHIGDQPAAGRHCRLHAGAAALALGRNPGPAAAAPAGHLGRHAGFWLYRGARPAAHFAVAGAAGALR